MAPDILRSRRPAPERPPPRLEMPWRSQRALARALARRLDLTVEGRERVPASGPVIIAARHYHHLYDGVALLTTLGRPLRVLVAADWAAGRGRSALAALCRAADWPMVLRPRVGATADPPGAQRQLLVAIRHSVRLVARGDLLLVFPEGYPTIDPNASPKDDGREFLPFAPGFARIAALTEAETGVPVPIIPAGFHYVPGERWRVTLRFGTPLWRGDFAAEPALIAATEAAVMALSLPPADR